MPMAQPGPRTVQPSAGIDTGGTRFLDTLGHTVPGWPLLQHPRFSHPNAIKDASGERVADARQPLPYPALAPYRRFTLDSDTRKFA
ncbi:hypothetical protein GCM10027040_16940 [Halomonas shantousis]